MRLRDRSTNDNVIMILAVSISVLILISGVTIILIVLFRPTTDISEAASGIGDIINTVVGALIGYLAGSSKRDTDNRDQNPPEPPTTE